MATLSTLGPCAAVVSGPTLRPCQSGSVQPASLALKLRNRNCAGHKFRLAASQQDIGKEAQDNLKSAADRAKEGAQDLGDRVKEAVTGTAEKGEEAKDRALQGGDAAGDKAKGVVEELREGAEKARDEAGKRIQDAGDNFRSTALLFPDWLLALMKPTPGFAALLGSLVLLTSLPANAATMTITTPEPQYEVARSLYENLIISGRLRPSGPVGLAQAKGIQETASRMGQRESGTRAQLSVPALERGSDNSLSGLKNVGESGGEAARAARKGGEQTLNKASKGVEGAFENIKQQIPGGGFSLAPAKEVFTVAALQDKVGGDVKTTAGKVQDDISTTANKVKGDVTTTGNKVSGDLRTAQDKTQEFGDKAKDQGKGIVDSIKDAFTGVSEDAGARGSGAVDDVKGKAEGLLRGVSNDNKPPPTLPPREAIRGASDAAQAKDMKEVEQVQKQSRFAALPGDSSYDVAGFFGFGKEKASEAASNVQQTASSAKGEAENLGDKLQRNTGEALDFFKQKSKDTEIEGPKKLAESLGSGNAPNSLSKAADNSARGAYESGANLAKEESKTTTTNGGFDAGRLLEEEKKGNIL